MTKLGYLSIITGLLIFIGYGMYQLMIDLSMPFILKVALIMIVLGVVVIIGKQIVDRRNEKSETDDYKKY